MHEYTSGPFSEPHENLVPDCFVSLLLTVLGALWTLSDTPTTNRLNCVGGQCAGLERCGVDLLWRSQIVRGKSM